MKEYDERALWEEPVEDRAAKGVSGSPVSPSSYRSMITECPKLLHTEVSGTLRELTLQGMVSAISVKNKSIREITCEKI